jgi:cation diffusion facilitator CzcD-associated flavoprotein CzcO
MREIRGTHVVMATGASSETPKIPFFAERVREDLEHTARMSVD